MSEIDPLYILARRVLLDALEALGTHRDAIVLVGAQAIYLWTGDTDLAVAPYTTDGDLVVNPLILAEIPPLEKALEDGGFERAIGSVGIWKKGVEKIAIDLLVPASVSKGDGRRAAKLEGHHEHVARKVLGLDGALVDADIKTLAALEDSDLRSFDVHVAGPAALLVAKVHKIKDRMRTGRQSDKDALDVLRLLQLATDGLAARYARLLADDRSKEAASEGRALIEAQFTKDGDGIEMAARAAAPLMDGDFIRASCEALASDLLAAIR